MTAKYSRQVAISLPRTWSEELLRLAEEENRTLSGQVRHLLKPALGHLDKKGKADDDSP